jgi:sulfide:quinone oxidoreductase
MKLVPKRIVILGAGTAGTMVANHLAKLQKTLGVHVSIVDQSPEHYYQPGFLLYPFGHYKKTDIIKPKTKFLPKSVEYIEAEIDRVEARKNVVYLKNSQALSYDVLIVATGSRIAPEMIPGMFGDSWHKTIFDFFTFKGASALREFLKTWPGGTFVVHITEMPIKCPVAPLEFAFLADAYFKKRGIRDKVKLKFVTPLSGAFTKPKASQKLGYLLQEKHIEIVPDFGLEKITNNKLVSYDERKVPFDVLVTVPTNTGDAMVERSGLGDELNFIPTDHHTLQSKDHENIFVIGDATNVPTSKAGSVAHFQTKTLIKNLQRYLRGESLQETFDGHANCFVETGGKKALLLDFNYDTEPLEGVFPFPLFGPLRLLHESRLNHIGKLAFRFIYWLLLLPGRPIPGIPTQMRKAGKKID